MPSVTVQRRPYRLSEEEKEMFDSTIDECQHYKAQLISFLISFAWNREHQ